MRSMKWGLLLLVSAWSASVDAQIWVITRGEPVGDLEQARETVAQALAGEGNVVGMQRMTEIFEERISSPPAFVTQRQINEWATQSRNALHSLARADYDAARQELLRAQRLSQRAAEELNREADRAREVLDTCLYMVRALIETGDESRAVAQARECRRSVPQVQPSRFRHTPEVRAILERLEAEQTDDVGNLRVDSVPPGCRVRLNGIEVGRTPFSMADLALGEYRVQVECGEERGRVHRVRLEELLTTLEVDTVFEREAHSRPVFVDDNDRARAHAARLARLLGVSIYLVGAHGEGRFRVRRIETDGEASSEPVPLAQLATAAQRLAHATLGSQDASGNEAVARAPSERLVGWRLGTGLATLGAGVALTVGAVVAHLHRDRRGDQYAIAEPTDVDFLVRQERWLNFRRRVLGLGLTGALLATASVPLLGRGRRSVAIAGAVGAAGGVATTLALLLTRDTCGNIAVDRRSCVDREQRGAQAMFVGGASLALVMLPLLPLFLSSDEPASEPDASAAAVSLRVGVSPWRDGALLQVGGSL